MPRNSSVPSGRSRYWAPLAVRGLLYVAVGLAVTFSVDHSQAQGMLLFGCFTVLSAVVIGPWSARALDRPWSVFFLVQSCISLVVGVLALTLRGGTVSTWMLLVVIWAGATGVIELVAAIRARGRIPYSREWLFTAALTMVLAVVFVVVPVDFRVEYGGLENVPGAQTASVLTLGVFGAYAIVVGVYLVIAALGYKWGLAEKTVEPSGEREVSAS